MPKKIKPYPLELSALELAVEVIRWAKTPGTHDGNPYFYPMVVRAQQVLAIVGMDSDDIKPAENLTILASKEYAKSHGIS